jgi:hypothetical protein
VILVHGCEVVCSSLGDVTSGMLSSYVTWLVVILHEIQF